MNYLHTLGLVSLIFATACETKQKKKSSMDIMPPKVEKIAKNLEMHDDVREDGYYWLNDRENPEVIDYLERENAYYQEKTAHTKDFQSALFKEMKNRIKEDDESVPYKLNGYYYITRYETGKDYPIYTRKKENLDAAEEIMFDVNELGVDHSYFNLNSISVSPDNRMATFGVDTVSRRNYTIYIKNLVTGEVLNENIPLTTGGATWASDNKTIFYTRKDEQTLRSNEIYRHTLGVNTEDDVRIFTEEDETFGTYVYKTKSKKYIIIGSYSTLTSEFQILSANDPNGEFKVFQKRTRGLEYDIAHYENDFYIVTNKDKATNFKLMKTPDTATGMENWKDVIAHRKNVFLEDIEIFKDYLVVSERDNGLNKINIKRWDSTEDYYLPFDNETYTAGASTNPDFDSEVLRYGYSSLTTPSSTIDFNMRTKEISVLKETEILGGEFNKANYESKRVWATAEDGTKIPVSMIYKKGMKMNGKNPLLLYAYGSYGATIDPYFSSVRLTLLDRGFIFAIAHIRGGQYLGREWYEDGKLLKKKNTFTDFVAVSKFMISEGFTSNKHLYAQGGSAGGLLMGAVVNIAPELYNGVLAEVPFVDVVTTMLDDTIPLTTGEYDEWGDPNDPEYYQYMKLYSPYDNVETKEYPNMFVTTGLFDSQVQYWEPAKWVARLREMKTDTNILLLDTNMEAGHSGASGRFEALKEVAKNYAFIFDLEGITE